MGVTTTGTPGDNNKLRNDLTDVFSKLGYAPDEAGVSLAADVANAFVDNLPTAGDKLKALLQIPNEPISFRNRDVVIPFPRSDIPLIASEEERGFRNLLERLYAIDPQRLAGIVFDFDEATAQKHLPLSSSNIQAALIYGLWEASGKNALLSPSGLKFVHNFLPTLLSLQAAVFVANDYKPLLLYTNAYPDKLAKYFNANPFVRMMYMGTDYSEREVSGDEVALAPNIMSRKDLAETQVKFLDAMKRKVEKSGFAGLSTAELFAYADLILHGSGASKHEVILAFTSKSGFLVDGKIGNELNPGHVRDLVTVDNELQVGLDQSVVIPRTHPEGRLFQHPLFARGRLATVERTLQFAEPAIYEGLLEALEARPDETQMRIVVESMMQGLRLHQRPQHASSRVSLGLREMIREYTLVKDSLKRAATAARKKMRPKDLKHLAEIYTTERNRRLGSAKELHALSLDPVRKTELIDGDWQYYGKSAPAKDERLKSDYLKFVEQGLPYLLQMAKESSVDSQEKLEAAFAQAGLPTNTQMYYNMAEALNASSIILSAGSTDLFALLMKRPEMIGELLTTLEKASILADTGRVGSPYLHNFFERVADEMMQRIPLGYRGIGSRGTDARLKQSLPQPAPKPQEGLRQNWADQESIAQYLSPALIQQFFGPRKPASSDIGVQEESRIAFTLSYNVQEFMKRIDVLDTSRAYEYLLNQFSEKNDLSILNFISAAKSGEDNSLRALVNALTATSLIYRGESQMHPDGALDLDKNYYALRYPLVMGQAAIDQLLAKSNKKIVGKEYRQSLKALQTYFHQVSDVLTQLYKQRYQDTPLVDMDWPKLETLPREWHRRFLDASATLDFDLTRIPDDYPREPAGAFDVAATQSAAANRPGVLSRSLQFVGGNTIGMAWAERHIAKRDVQRFQSLFELTNKLQPGAFDNLAHYKTWVESESARLKRTERDLNQNAFYLYSSDYFAQLGIKVEDGTFAGVRESHFNREVDIYFQIIRDPKNAEPKGTILIAPDESKTMGEYFDFARNLVSEGYQVMIYDPRGQGLSSPLWHKSLGRAHRMPGYLDSFDALEGDLQRAARWAHQKLGGPLDVVADGRSAMNLFDLKSRHPKNVAGIRHSILLDPFAEVDPYLAKINDPSIIEVMRDQGTTFSGALRGWWNQLEAATIGNVLETTRLTLQAPKSNKEKSQWDNGWNTPRAHVAQLEYQAAASATIDALVHGRRHGLVDGRVFFSDTNPTWGRSILGRKIRVAGEPTTIAGQMGLQVSTATEGLNDVIKYLSEHDSAQAPLPGKPSKRALHASIPLHDVGSSGDILSNMLLGVLFRYRSEISATAVKAIGKSLLKVGVKLQEKLTKKPGMKLNEYSELLNQAMVDIFDTNPGINNLLGVSADLKQAIREALAQKLTPRMDQISRQLGNASEATLVRSMHLLCFHPAALDVFLGKMAEREKTPMADLAQQMIFETTPTPPSEFEEWQQLFEAENKVLLERLTQIGTEVAAVWNIDHSFNLDALFAGVRKMKVNSGMAPVFPRAPLPIKLVKAIGLLAPAIVFPPMLLAGPALNLSVRGGAVATNTDEESRVRIAEAILDSVIYSQHPEFKEPITRYLRGVDSDVAGLDPAKFRAHVKDYRKKLFALVDTLDIIRDFGTERRLNAANASYVATPDDENIPEIKTSMDADLAEHITHNHSPVLLALQRMKIQTAAGSEISLTAEVLEQLFFRGEEAPATSPLNPFKQFVDSIVKGGIEVQDKFKAILEAEKSFELPDFTPVADAEMAFRKSVFENETIQRVLNNIYSATPEERESNRVNMIKMMDLFQIVYVYHRMQSEIASVGQGGITIEHVEKSYSEVSQLVYAFIKIQLVKEYAHFESLKDTSGAATHLIESKQQSLLAESQALEAWNQEVKLPNKDPFALLDTYGLAKRLGMNQETVNSLGRSNENLAQVWQAFDAVQASLEVNRVSTFDHVMKTAQARLELIQMQKVQSVNEMKQELLYQAAYYPMLIARAQDKLFELGRKPDPLLMKAINIAYAEYAKIMNEAIKYSEEILDDEVAFKYFAKVSLDKAAARAYVTLHDKVAQLYDLLTPDDRKLVHAYSAIFPQQALILENRKTGVENYAHLLRIAEDVVQEVWDCLKGVVDSEHIAELQHRFGLDGLSSFFNTARYGFSKGTGKFYNFSINKDVLENAWADGVDVDILDYNDETTIFRFKQGVIQLQNHTGQLEFLGFSNLGMSILAQDTVRHAIGIGPAIEHGDIASFLKRDNPKASKANVLGFLARGKNTTVYWGGTRAQIGYRSLIMNLAKYGLASVLFPPDTGDSYTTGYAFGFGNATYIPSYQNGGSVWLSDEGSFGSFVGGAPMSATRRDASAIAAQDAFPWMTTGDGEFMDIKGRPVQAAGLLLEEHVSQFFQGYRDHRGRQLVNAKDHSLFKEAQKIFNETFHKISNLGHRDQVPVDVTSADSFSDLYIEAMALREKRVAASQRGVKTHRRASRVEVEIIKQAKKVGLSDGHYSALKKIRILMYQLNSAYMKVEQRFLAETPRKDTPHPLVGWQVPETTKPKITVQRSPKIQIQPNTPNRISAGSGMGMGALTIQDGFTDEFGMPTFGQPALFGAGMVYPGALGVGFGAIGVGIPVL